MKRFLLSLFATALFMPALAQLGADGYYRVKNFKSQRYIIMIDNKSKGVDPNSTTYDLDAMMTIKPFSKVAAEAGSVVYIQNCGGNQYNLIAQGTDVHATTGRYLTLTTGSSSQHTYFASAVVSGVTVYLFDEQYMGTEGRLSTANNAGAGGDVYRHWLIQPISATSDDNYFGIKSDVTAGGKHYAAAYYSFPYSFASSGMKAYSVTKLDGEYAVWQPVDGVVAGATPVIVECPGTEPSDNRLNLLASGGVSPAGNLLKGVYLNNSWVDFISETSYHFNATRNDASTMRLLGVTSEGKLGFVKSSEKYIPENTAYLTVPAGSPDEITLVTQAEYDAILAADAVTVTARDCSREYGEANPTFEYDVEGTLKGQPSLSCSATPSSPVGTYPIVVTQGTVTNRSFTAHNGTLTVTQAPLTVTARSFTIKQNESLPQFVCDYAGFKLGETAAVLSAKPQLACDVPADRTPGTYPITVSGAEAQNYSITHVAGTLTILEADPITVTATSLSKEYGDALPKLSWTVEGGTLTGEPELQCEATESSLPGTYSITLSKGTIDYPNLILVDGTLTVTKAPLTISTGTYTMKQTDELPTFEPIYEGFKLGETESVLTSKPQMNVVMPTEGAYEPGEYEIEVSGAQADNYDISYRSGRLVITEADQVVVVAADATMVYGDPLPQFTYQISGDDVEGQPVVSCEATSASPVGTYPIVVQAGTISYPNLKLVNGTLTITKAPLKASVADYSREQGQENPVFEVLYEGFRNGDDASVLIAAPVATTSATAASPAGVYDITVSGGEAQNYAFTYVGGKLTVTVPSGIASLVLSAPADVYSLTGRKLRSQATSLQGLPRGVYVVNGRKVVVK